MTESGPCSEQSMLRTWRANRKISIREVSRRSGVHRSTIMRWEADQAHPSVPEMERVMDILEVSEGERKAFWQQYRTPRALRQVSQTESALPLALGDLLRAMRMRAAKTQEEVSSRAGVSQGLLARWENNVSTPPADRLHTLCDALDANAEEVAALTAGDYQEIRPLPTNSDDLYESFHQLTYHNDSPHKDLLFLAHGAQFLRLVYAGKAKKEMLSHVWGRQAHHVQWRLHRQEDAIRYGEAALALVPASTQLEAHLTATVIAVAQAWVGQGSPRTGARYLMRRQEQARLPVYRQWIQSALAYCLFEAGDRQAALTLATRAFGDAQAFRDDFAGDFLNRMWDYVSLLLSAGDGETALRTLEQYSIFPSPHYDASDHLKERLLMVEARALVGQRQEALSLLSQAREQSLEKGSPFIDRVDKLARLLQ